MGQPDFRVGDWLVQPSLCRLSRDAGSARVRAKVMDLLVFMAAHAGEVLSKDVLLNAVWGTEAVSESALTRSMTELRHAFGDNAEAPTVIETISKRGYRLIAPVSSIGIATAAVTGPVTKPSFFRWTARFGIVPLATLGWTALFMASPPAPIHFQARDWILVTAFENRTGDPLLDGTIEYAFEHELSYAAFVSVVPRDRVNDALRLMRKPTNTRVDVGVGREVCLRDGSIRALVAGRIEKAGAGYLLTAEVVNPTTGVSVTALRDELPATSDVLTAVRRDVVAIRRTLGENPESLHASQEALAHVTTPSMRALQAYSRADAVLSAGLAVPNDVAERLLRDAIREEPGFAAAHTLLAWVIHNGGGRSDEYLAEVMEARRLSDATMPVERHFIEGSVHSLLAEASGDDSVRERELLQAAAEYESALREQPAHFWAATNLRQAYHRLGRLDEAAAFARLARLRPNDFSSLVLAADALLGAGGRDAASPYIARARALLDVLSSDTQYPEARKSYVLLFQAHDLWVDRRTKDATAFLDAVARRAEIAAEGDLAWGRLGSLYLSLGQLRRAEQTFARISDLQSRAFWTASVALARNDDRMVVARLGITHPSDLSVVSMLVRADELPVAERALRSIHVITPPHDIWAVQEIEEARGNQRVVSDALKAGLPWTRAMSPPGVRVFMYSETLARAASATGDIAAAIRVLEETGMLGEKTYTRASHTGYFWMRTQLLLADLYRQASRTDAARAIERDLLAALAAADTDYPIVIELKKRVSR